ncbi:hypothetical protein [uncultured Litoreibacter sp.]|uniref:hypothetical protein n=1 Tax=uncultured Litoreibacter sp. TaxID=1392394 RepID=UPI002618C9E0|nr:hypothetical protein [uncultured Litoreibacter sp.]
MTQSIDPLRSRAGRILYRELPEEYRYRDGGSDAELGDLEALLHGFGALLDQVRNTTEQAYADAFAEPQPDGRAMQSWLVPYMAELFGAELTAPDPDQRVSELNNAVSWFKSKGTLASVDSVSDVVAGTETVAREGWRHVATCPRVGLPPFTVPPKMVPQREKDALTAGMRPQGTPDMRQMNRAVQDPEGSNPLFRIKPEKMSGERPVYWRQRAPGGAPCFPLAYDDMTPRCPDMRDPTRVRRVGPHPRRTLIHVRPPQGMFDVNLPHVSLRTEDLLALLAEKPRLVAEDLLSPMDPADLAGITRVVLEIDAPLDLPDGAFYFEGIRFVGPVGPSSIRGAAGTEIMLRDCAVHSVSLAGEELDAVGLDAADCIFHDLTCQNRIARLEYCTLTGDAILGRIQASDCVFNTLTDTLICPPDESLSDGAPYANCVRFSRFAPVVMETANTKCLDTLSVSNTTDPVYFVDRWHRLPDGTCVKRTAEYGEPSYGVLDTDTGTAITQGAEDEGEMGAGHGLHLAASLTAIRRKLETFLPVGQEIAIFYDPHLAHTPPVLLPDTSADA